MMHKNYYINGNTDTHSCDNYDNSNHNDKINHRNNNNDHNNNSPKTTKQHQPKCQ